MAHGIAGEARARQPGGRPDRDARRQLGLGEDAQAPPPHRAHVNFRTSIFGDPDARTSIF